MINLSNTTPAAQAGGTNGLWQSDASGNISVYFAVVKRTVAPVAGVLTLDAATGSSFYVDVNDAIASMSILNPTDGQEITILWSQDATGHAVATAGNLLGSYSVTTTANAQSCYRFTYNLSDTNWYQIGANNM